MSAEIWEELRERWSAMEPGELLGSWPQDLLEAMLSGMYPELRERALRFLARQLETSVPAVRERWNSEAEAAGAHGEADGQHDIVARYLRDTAEEQKIVLGGEVHVFNELSGLWTAIRTEGLAMSVMRDYAGAPYCKTKSDFFSIAELIVTHLLVEQEGMYGRNRTPFDDAPMGCAVGMEFCRLTPAGVEREPLRREHYQRFAIPASLDNDEDAPKWFGFLRYAMRDEAIRRHLAQHILVAVFRLGVKMQKALFWLGETRTGKNTMQAILEAMFPPETIGALPPDRWTSQFDLINLRGRFINIVGEVNHSSPMDRSFISVLGGDVISARHPHGKNVEFRSEATHIINGNRSSLPSTRERHGEFWRRVDVLAWNHTYTGVPDVSLANDIIRKELHAVVQFAFSHAAGLVDENGNVLDLAQDDESAELQQDWRDEVSTVVNFLKGKRVKCVVFDEGPRTKGNDGYFELVESLRRRCPSGFQWLRPNSARQPSFRIREKSVDLFKQYQAWCRFTHVRQPFGEERFFKELTRVAPEFGLEKSTAGNAVRWKGVAIVDPEWDGSEREPPRQEFEEGAEEEGEEEGF